LLLLPTSELCESQCQDIDKIIKLPGRQRQLCWLSAATIWWPTNLNILVTGIDDTHKAPCSFGNGTSSNCTIALAENGALPPRRARALRCASSA